VSRFWSVLCPKKMILGGMGFLKVFYAFIRTFNKMVSAFVILFFSIFCTNIFKFKLLNIEIRCISQTIVAWVMIAAPTNNVLIWSKSEVN